MLAVVGQLSGGSRAEKLLELPLRRAWDWVKVRLMNGKVSSAAGIYWPIIQNGEIDRSV